MSAYLLYQNAMREQFKKDNPGMTFGQLAKYTSHMYRSLTTEEKSEWEQRAAQDKVRFDAEMEAYVPPPGHDANGNLLEEYARAQRGRQKKNRDPNAPKRACGSYVFFTNVIRPEIAKEYPDIKFTEMGNIMGERWRALGAEEKKKYEALAAEDKERFAREMEVYTAQKEAVAAAQAAQNQAEQEAAAADQAVSAVHEQYDYHDPNSVYMQHAHDPNQHYYHA
mmetsp:Transcript_28193/g.57212  ORF Transcript_28193/g.57212 Transcript_28193/m.57212 type:complete len:223 (-) Transcript_28193:309-977(-)